MRCNRECSCARPRGGGGGGGVGGGGGPTLQWTCGRHTKCYCVKKKHQE